jgi:hypothetical protein
LWNGSQHNARHFSIELTHGKGPLFSPFIGADEKCVRAKVSPRREKNLQKRRFFNDELFITRVFRLLIAELMFDKNVHINNSANVAEQERVMTVVAIER